MADFTHIMRVTATLDDGRVITMENTHTIELINHVQQLNGSADAHTIPDGLPPGELPDFVIFRSPNAYFAPRIVNANTDALDIEMGADDMFILHGPESFTTSGNAGDTTNTENLDYIDFDLSGNGKKVEAMALSTVS